MRKTITRKAGESVEKRIARLENEVAELRSEVLSLQSALDERDAAENEEFIDHLFYCEPSRSLMRSH